MASALRPYSQNENVVENELSTSQMKKSQIILDFLLLADKEPTATIEP